MFLLTIINLINTHIIWAHGFRLVEVFLGFTPRYDIKPTVSDKLVQQTIIKALEENLDPPKT